MQTLTDNLKARNPKGAFVDTHTPEEYATYKNFTTPDKWALISVKPDGDIINFVTDWTPWKWKELMFTAIENGGTKMDNYWEWLVRYYEKFGFKPVAKVKFNREYAPANWNFARDWEPYIYAMKHNGDDIAKVRENYWKYEHMTSDELDKLPELEYDQALEFRDNLIEEWRKQKEIEQKQQEILDTSKANKESIFEKYRQAKSAEWKEWASYVNPDDFRPLVNEAVWGNYEANLTHEGASWLADQYFKELLDKSWKGSKWVVVAGWPWAWKWYSAKQLWIDAHDYDIFVDKTKGNKELKAMLEKWLDTKYYAVIPEVDNIISQISWRAISKWRTLPIKSVWIPTHKNVVKVVKDIIELKKNGWDFEFNFIYNSWKKGAKPILLSYEDWYKLFEDYAKKLDEMTPERIEKEVRSYTNKEGKKLNEAQVRQLVASMGWFLAVMSLLGSGD